MTDCNPKGAINTVLHSLWKLAKMSHLYQQNKILVSIFVPKTNVSIFVPRSKGVTIFVPNINKKNYRIGTMIIIFLPKKI